MSGGNWKPSDFFSGLKALKFGTGVLGMLATVIVVGFAVALGTWMGFAGQSVSVGRDCWACAAVPRISAEPRTEFLPLPKIACGPPAVMPFFDGAIR
jgi:hypothetical protein